jgi:hypothetical protein
MKIAIMVMAANVEPSTRNLDAIQNTLVKYQNEHKDKFKNEYDFYFYWSGGENLDEEVKISNSEKYNNLKFIEVKEEESIYRTFEKSIKAFDYIERNGYYDWYVRMNISMWLNIDLLDSVIGTNFFRPLFSWLLGMCFYSLMWTGLHIFFFRCFLSNLDSDIRIGALVLWLAFFTVFYYFHLLDNFLIFDWFSMPLNADTNIKWYYWISIVATLYFAYKE